MRWPEGQAVGTNQAGAYLGYDPMALTTLASLLRRTAVGLRNLPLTDPAASHARGHVHQAIDRVEHWAGITAAIASCAVMEGYEHVAVEPHLPYAVPWSWQASGMALLSDPMAPGSDTDLRSEAAVSANLLRERLRQDPTAVPLTSDEIIWLVASFRRWSADRGALAAWRRALGTDAQIMVVEHLARLSDRHERMAASRADSAYRSGSIPAPTSSIPAHDLLALVAVGLPPSALERLPIDAAARALTHVGLRGDVLAESGRGILRRWAATEWWIEAGQTERNVADRVVGTVSRDAVAARSFVLGLGDDLPVALFGPNDADAPRQLWLAATDPRHGTPHDAGPVVRHLLDHLRAEPLTATSDMVRFTFDPSTRPLYGVDPTARWHHVRHWVGEVVAPWQPYLTGMTDVWGWSVDDGMNALRWVASDPGAAAALAAGIGVSLAPALDQLPDDRQARAQMVDQLGWSIGASDEVLRDAAVADAVHQRWAWSLFAFAAHRGTSAAVGALTGGAPTPLPQLAGTLANGATSRIIDHLDGDEEGERLAIQAAGLDRLQTARTALVTVLFHELVRVGRIHPDTPPPPHPTPIDHRDPRAGDPLVDWINDAPLTAEIRVELMHAAGAVTGSSDRGALAAS